MAEVLAHGLLQGRTCLYERIGWNRHCVVGSQRYDASKDVDTEVCSPLLARKLNLPIYQLLGGRVRDKIKVYAWIGGDRPSDVEAEAFVHPVLILK